MTEVTALEYPPIINYTKFYGKIYLIQRKDIVLAFELQVRLRKIGKPKGLSDLLISAICINRQEELITHDDNFKNIAETSNLKVKII